MTKLGLIAGGGGLPLALADHCRQTGRPYFVIRLRGFADGSMDAYPGDVGRHRRDWSDREAGPRRRLRGALLRGSGAPPGLLRVEARPARPRLDAGRRDGGAQGR